MSWKSLFFDEVAERIDPERVHFTGRLAYSDYLSALQISSVHVYLTYPFVLSWSLLDAMACGAPIVGSDTQPVREVIDGGNGVLADFHSPEDLADKVVGLLEDRERARALGAAARATVEARYALKDLLPRHSALVTGSPPECAPGRDPSPACNPAR